MICYNVSCFIMLHYDPTTRPLRVHLAVPRYLISGDSQIFRCRDGERGATLNLKHPLSGGTNVGRLFAIEASRDIRQLGGGAA
jgi:hypothetical protein